MAVDLPQRSRKCAPTSSRRQPNHSSPAGFGSIEVSTLLAETGDPTLRRTLDGLLATARREQALLDAIRRGADHFPTGYRRGQPVDSSVIREQFVSDFDGPPHPKCPHSARLRERPISIGTSSRFSCSSRIRACRACRLIGQKSRTWPSTFARSNNGVSREGDRAASSRPPDYLR